MQLQHHPEIEPECNRQLQTQLTCIQQHNQHTRVDRGRA
jgi:hypothetical protein